MVRNFVKTFIKSRGASRLGLFSTPKVEGGYGSPIAEREGWAKWGRLGSFASPLVAGWVSASAVAERDDWAEWGQLGSFASLRLGVGVHHHYEPRFLPGTVFDAFEEATR